AKPETVEAAVMRRVAVKPEDQVHVAHALRHLGSKESLQALVYLLGAEKVDVRCVALDSLVERLDADALPYLREFTKRRTFEEKWWAEKWLAAYGTADDVPWMLDRLETLFKRRRKRSHSPPEVSYLIPF